MNEKNIKDIPSMKKHKDDIQSLKSLLFFLRIIPIIRKKIFVQDMGIEINNLENQFKELSEAPDLFNQYFCQIGWIAYESMSVEIMLSAVQFAKEQKMSKAEEVLLLYYSPEHIELFLIRCRIIPQFLKRYDLMEQAISDYRENRFSSCVLYLLVVIDGIVNDIVNTGFFADNTDLTAWDSIAGHSTGLEKLKELFHQSRKKTNTDEITVPYRNGILHGRDINFNNKYVAAKCWSALIAVYHWAMAQKNNEKLELEEDDSLSLIDTIKSYIKTKEQINKTNAFIENWKPRSLKIGQDIPEWGNIEEYEQKSPEQQAIKIMSYWEKGQWAKITPLLWDCLKLDISHSKEAVKLKNMLVEETPKPVKISKVDDQSSKITEVHILVEFMKGIWEGQRIIFLRFVYEAIDGTLVVRGDEKGDWFLIKDSLVPKEYSEQ